MERLTHRYGPDGRAVPTEFDIGPIASIHDDDIWAGFDAMVDRLAAYEDSIPFDRLDEAAALVKARDERRVVVLPCKAGDTVWAVTSPSNIPNMSFDDEQPGIFECNVKSITMYHQSSAQFRLYYKGSFVAWLVQLSDFGKTVFLTHAEAEAALSSRKGETHESN